MNHENNQKPYIARTAIGSDRQSRASDDDLVL